MMEASIWIIGKGHADFSPAVDWLHSVAACECIDGAAAAIAALQSTARSRDPAVIALLQSHPGQFGEREVERLHAAVPLARLVALAGPWCEGEKRSGRPWRGVVRIPWQAWQTCLPREVPVSGLSDRRGSPLPRTITETERIERSVTELVCPKRFSAAAAMCTSNRAMFESIAEALRILGLEAHWHSAGPRLPMPTADVVIFDGWDQIAPAEPCALPPRLLLLHFPRPEDTVRAAASGIAAVLSQPLMLADLSAALDRLVSSCAAADARALTAAAGRN